MFVAFCRVTACKELPRLDHSRDRNVIGDLGYLEYRLVSTQVTGRMSVLSIGKALMVFTYNKHSNSHVSSPKHPEGPGCKPSIAVVCRLRKDFIFEKSVQN